MGRELLANRIRKPILPENRTRLGDSKNWRERVTWKNFF
jgi:hypothetical protein